MGWEKANEIGAFIYYLRRVLHSYPDAKCVTILMNIAAAMSPSTSNSPASRLLIGEYIVPPRVTIGGELTVYTKDMACLTIHGKERTEKEFQILLEQASLKLVKVWRAEGGGEQGVVEAVLKE
jgi:demethylsterigmatocystin 6-O-methyltransferase